MGQNTPVEFKMDTFLAPWDQPSNMHLDQNGNVDLRARRCIVLSGKSALHHVHRDCIVGCR